MGSPQEIKKNDTLFMNTSLSTSPENHLINLSIDTTPLSETILDFSSFSISHRSFTEGLDNNVGNRAPELKQSLSAPGTPATGQVLLQPSELVQPASAPSHFPTTSHFSIDEEVSSIQSTVTLHSSTSIYEHSDSLNSHQPSPPLPSSPIIPLPNSRMSSPILSDDSLIPSLYTDIAIALRNADPFISKLDDLFSSLDIPHEIKPKKSSSSPELSQIAAFLGSPDDFNERVLDAYMALFDFREETVDNSLRKLCSILYMKAESQQLDRILLSFANRYVTCNPDSPFETADIIHGLSYSLILLNTDLHIVNSNMSQHQFVENTLQAILYPPEPFIDPLLLPEVEEEEEEEEEKIPEERSKSDEEIEREDKLRELLKDLYQRIKQDRIEQPADVQERAQKHSIFKMMQNKLMNKKFGRRLSTPVHVLRQSEVKALGNSSSASLKENKKRHSIFTTKEEIDSAKTLNFLNISDSDLIVPISPINGEVDLSAVFNNAEVVHQKMKEECPGDFLNDSPLTESQLEDEATPVYSSKEFPDSIIHWGRLLRKNDYLCPGYKSYMRKWINCSVTIQRGKECIMELSAVLSGVDSHNHFFSEEKYPLQHSLALEHPYPPGYSYSRPFVFTFYPGVITSSEREHSISGMFGPSFLFQCESLEEMRKWVSLINFWSARQTTLLPLKDSHFNIDFNSILASKKSIESEKDSEKESSSFESGQIYFDPLGIPPSRPSESDMDTLASIPSSHSDATSERSSYTNISEGQSIQSLTPLLRINQPHSSLSQTENMSKYRFLHHSCIVEVDEQNEFNINTQDPHLKSKLKWLLWHEHFFGCTYSPFPVIRTNPMHSPLFYKLSKNWLEWNLPAFSIDNAEHIKMEHQLIMFVHHLKHILQEIDRLPDYKRLIQIQFPRRMSTDRQVATSAYRKFSSYIRFEGVKLVQYILQLQNHSSKLALK